MCTSVWRSVSLFPHPSPFVRLKVRHPSTPRPTTLSPSPTRTDNGEEELSCSSPSLRVRGRAGVLPHVLTRLHPRNAQAPLSPRCPTGRGREGTVVECPCDCGERVSSYGAPQFGRGTFYCRGVTPAACCRRTWRRVRIMQKFISEKQ